MLGTMVQVISATGRIERLSRGLCRSDDVDAALREIGAFRQRRVARLGASGGGADSALAAAVLAGRRSVRRRKRCDLKPCGIAKPSLRQNRLSRINFDIFP